MSRCTQVFDASPEAIFAVLSDPASYPEWVVGAQAMRDADAGFPAKGTKLHHRVGFGPFTIEDHTEVVDVAAPYRLELRAKARPLGTARVVMLVSPRGEGSSYVTMIEEPADPLTKLVFNPLTHLLVRGRNQECLRRLKRLAEAPATAAADGR